MSFADALMRRGARAAAGARASAVREIADFAEQELPGVAAEPSEGAVWLSGRQLRRRIDGDPRLRWIAAFWKGQR